MLRLDKSADEIRELLRRVIARFPDHLMDLDSIEDRVASGEFQVFPLDNSVIVGKTYKNGWVWLFAGAGSLKEILDFEPTLCQWYRQRGYVTMWMEGRKGWIRVLKDIGWGPSEYDGVLRKVIN
jgi:hypothetical protein